MPLPNVKRGFSEGLKVQAGSASRVGEGLGDQLRDAKNT
jgi:hypothetical protein